MSETILSVRHATKIYGKGHNAVKALNDLSFHVQAHDFVAIMGSSGSGKTTLLSCIATIDTLTSGQIELHGQNIQALKGKALQQFRLHELGYIFQDFNLLPELTNLENITIGLQGKTKGIEKKIHAMVETMDIKDLLDRYPDEISGGQRQRVACVRALVKQPSLILADEPTGALDHANALMVLDTLKRMNTDYGSTIMMVTHDPLAASYASRVLMIHDGTIIHHMIRYDETNVQYYQRILHMVETMGISPKGMM